MLGLDDISKMILNEVADITDEPQGAYNFRVNSGLAGRNTTENINIVSKENGSGIDIFIKPDTKGENVHIPVVISESGVKEKGNHRSGLRHRQLRRARFSARRHSPLLCRQELAH